MEEVYFNRPVPTEEMYKTNINMLVAMIEEMNEENIIS